MSDESSEFDVSTKVAGLPVGTQSTTGVAKDGGTIKYHWLDGLEPNLPGVGEHVRAIVAFHCRTEFGSERSALGEKAASTRDIAALGRLLEPVLANAVQLRARHENLAACFTQIEYLRFGATNKSLVESAIEAIVRWREHCEAGNFGAVIETASDDSAQGLNSILGEIERVQAEHWQATNLATHRAGRELLDHRFWSGVQRIDEALLKLSLRAHRSGAGDMNLARSVLNQVMDLTRDEFGMVAPEVKEIWGAFFPQLSVEAERHLQQNTLDGLGEALASFCFGDCRGRWLDAAKLQHELMQSRIGTNRIEQSDRAIVELFERRLAFGTALSHQWADGRNLSICRTGCFQRLLTLLAPICLGTLKRRDRPKVLSWFASERSRASRPNDRYAERIPWQHEVVDALRVARDPSLAIAKVRSTAQAYADHLDWAVVSKAASLAVKQSGVLSLPRTWRDVGKEPKSKSDGFDTYCEKLFERYPGLRSSLGHAVKHGGQVERTVRPRPPKTGERCALLTAHHLQGTLGTAYRDFVVRQLRSMGLDGRALRIAAGAILVPMSPQWGGGCRGEWFTDAPHPREIYFVLHWLRWLSPKYASLLGVFRPPSN
jgi:hypothetical protein